MQRVTNYPGLEINYFQYNETFRDIYLYYTLILIINEHVATYGCRYAHMCASTCVCSVHGVVFVSVWCSGDTCWKKRGFNKTVARSKQKVTKLSSYRGDVITLPSRPDTYRNSIS